MPADRVYDRNDRIVQNRLSDVSHLQVFILRVIRVKGYEDMLRYDMINRS